MTQREINEAAALIRATPIEPVAVHLSADDEPDEFWTCDFPGIVAVIVIAGLFVWAAASLPA
jgi:hypothetical protein